MPKIFKNGVIRDATAEEIDFLRTMEEQAANMPAPEPTPEERIRDLEEALALILSGVTE